MEVSAPCPWPGRTLWPPECTRTGAACCNGCTTGHWGQATCISGLEKAGNPTKTADLKELPGLLAAIVPSLQSGAPTSCYFRRQEMTLSRSPGPTSPSLGPAGLPRLGLRCWGQRPGLRLGPGDGPLARQVTTAWAQDLLMVQPGRVDRGPGVVLGQRNDPGIPKTKMPKEDHS